MGDLLKVPPPFSLNGEKMEDTYKAGFRCGNCHTNLICDLPKGTNLDLEGTALQPIVNKTEKVKDIFFGLSTNRKGATHWYAYNCPMCGSAENDFIEKRILPKSTKGKHVDLHIENIHYDVDGEEPCL